MHLSFINRKTSVLSPSTIQCFKKGVATISPTIGCSHRCAYCYARGYLIYPGDNHVLIYDNLVEKLKQELWKKRKLPQIVFFSTSCDPFQPIPQALKITYDIMHILLDHNISVSFLTKGRIPLIFFKLFEKYRHLLHAKIGLITINRDIQQALEPYAASPDERLKNIKELINRDIDTEVRMDPIIPGVTDTLYELKKYFMTLQGLHAKRVGLNYLFLRNQIQKNLKKVINSMGLFEKILLHYKNGVRLDLKAENSHALALNTTYRKRNYELIANLASVYDIRTYVCGCKNPDITNDMICARVLNGFVNGREKQLILKTY